MKNNINSFLNSKPKQFKINKNCKHKYNILVDTFFVKLIKIILNFGSTFV